MFSVCTRSSDSVPVSPGNAPRVTLPGGRSGSYAAARAGSVVATSRCRSVRSVLIRTEQYRSAATDGTGRYRPVVIACETGRYRPPVPACSCGAGLRWGTGLRRGSNPRPTGPPRDLPGRIVALTESVGFLSQNHLSQPGSLGGVVSADLSPVETWAVREIFTRKPPVYSGRRWFRWGDPGVPAVAPGERPSASGGRWLRRTRDPRGNPVRGGGQTEN